MPPKRRALAGAQLQAFRAWLGLSQEDVGCILGLTGRTIQEFEAEGAPEFVRYALFGWAVALHGTTQRAAARMLGLPWKHYPLPEGVPPKPARGHGGRRKSMAASVARARRTRSPAGPDRRRKVPAAFARHLRLACALTLRELADRLQVDRSTAARFERVGAPPWILPAFAGLAVLAAGAGVGDVCAMLGLDPDGGIGRISPGHALCLQPLESLVVHAIRYVDRTGMAHTWP